MGYKLETYKLAELCDISSSKRIFQKEYVDSGIPFFRSKEVIGKAHGTFNSEDLLYISHKRYQEIKSAFPVPQMGEMLLSSVGNRSGIPYVIKEDDGEFYFKDGNLIWFKAFQDLDSNYLSYWIKSRQGQGALNGIMIGSAQKALTISGIQNLEITLPSLTTQKKIAHILSTLDDKIELNRKMNQTLEEMAQALFKSWFVDFDPVHAKADAKSDEALEGAAAELGVSKEVLELFPREFEESEMGMIPKGWNDYQLEMVSSLSAGGDKPKNATDTKTTINNIPIYSNGIKNEGLYGFTDTPKILAESVTVSARGTIGFVCLRFKPYVPIVRLISVVPNQDYLSSKYLFFWLKNQNISGFGTTQQQLTIPVFKQEKIIIPPLALMSNFSKRADIIYNKIQNNSSQIQILQKTRDTLLPKLLSGELNVSNIKFE